MTRVLLLGLLCALVAAAPTAARESRARLTGSCASVVAARISFDGRAAKVTTTAGTLLARATRTTRTVVPSCRRSARLGIARGLLDGSLRRGRLLCPRRGTDVIVETEPVRGASGRILGSRLALWMNGVPQELAEVFVAGRRSWFLYSKLLCHRES